MLPTILNVAYPFAPVGPDAVGGAEQVLSRLDEALANAGRRSVVLACDGSVTAGTLFSVPRSGGVLNEPALDEAHRRYREALQHVLDTVRVDLVHMHGIDFYRYLPPPGTPVLVTLHLPVDWYAQEIFELDRPKTYFHCVSADQSRRCPPCAKMLGPIENGVPGQWPMRKRNFTLSLGRICPEKGFHIALNAARRARVPWLLGGEIFRYPVHEAYFRNQIVPNLDGARRFIGPVMLKRKRRLLAAARCLLVPSLVAETSSLVAMEALAAGTPVVAFPSGAVAEIVEHGKTGFLVENEQQMADAIEACDRIEPEDCQEAARSRFSLVEMIRKYFGLYEQLTSDAGQSCEAGVLEVIGAS